MKQNIPSVLPVSYPNLNVINNTQTLQNSTSNKLLSGTVLTIKMRGGMRRTACAVYIQLWEFADNTKEYKVLLRKRFTITWKTEMNISLKVGAMNRRRRRFFSGVQHICQGQWRQYARMCPSVYNIWTVKNKIQNSSKCYRQYLLCTNLT
jgi:hypothetical protein